MLTTKKRYVSPGRMASDSPWIYLAFTLLSLIFLIPLLYILSISFQNEMQIQKQGYQLIPRFVDLTAYKFVLQNSEQILNSYQTTIFYSVVGTVLSVLIMSGVAYALAQKSFRLRSPITFFVFFTMLFSGGLVPSYILITQYLHLGNTIWVYIVPGLANAFSILLLRTYFAALPDSIMEAGRIDGASEFRMLFSIAFPLSTPAIATIAFLGLLGRWNDFFTSLMYIQDQKLYSLQYLLQKILGDAQFLRANFGSLPDELRAQLMRLPDNSARMAICLIVAGPMLVIFPFFQKYFVKGLTIGSIKG